MFQYVHLDEVWSVGKGVWNFGGSVVELLTISATLLEQTSPLTPTDILDRPGLVYIERQHHWNSVSHSAREVSRLNPTFRSCFVVPLGSSSWWCRVRCRQSTVHDGPDIWHLGIRSAVQGHYQGSRTGINTCLSFLLLRIFCLSIY